MPTPNPVILKITSSRGEFNFHEYDIPIIGRRADRVRKGDQGHSRQQISMTMTGWFLGNSHAQIQEKYEKLRNVLNANDATIYYFDGARVVINSLRAYIDNLNEPESWKQYDGFYNINLHYFEQPTYDAGLLGITASYSSSAGAYNFETPPIITYASTINREHYRGYRTTPGGTTLQPTIDLRLEGFLTANNHADLVAKSQALEVAFQKDGTLNYGNLSMRLFIERFEIPPVFPRDYLDYAITAKYEPVGVYDFVCSRSFSRLHRHPKIRERPYCGNPQVTLLSISGQEVSYNMKARGNSITECRNFLSQEAQLYVFQGGVELPGGTESENPQEISVTVSFRKYHRTPIFSNLPNT
jgi:hypothetical protein